MADVLVVVMFVSFGLGLVLLTGTLVNVLRHGSRRWFRALNLAWALCWTVAILAAVGHVTVWAPRP